MTQWRRASFKVSKYYRQNHNNLPWSEVKQNCLHMQYASCIYPCILYSSKKCIGWEPIEIGNYIEYIIIHWDSFTTPFVKFYINYIRYIMNLWYLRNLFLDIIIIFKRQNTVLQSSRISLFSAHFIQCYVT